MYPQKSSCRVYTRLITPTAPPRHFTPLRKWRRKKNNFLSCNDLFLRIPLVIDGSRGRRCVRLIVEYLLSDYLPLLGSAWTGVRLASMVDCITPSASNRQTIKVTAVFLMESQLRRSRPRHKRDTSRYHTPKPPYKVSGTWYQVCLVQHHALPPGLSTR